MAACWAYCDTGRMRNRRISRALGHLGACQGCISEYLELTSAVRVHRCHRLRAGQDVSRSVETRPAGGQAVLVDIGKGNDVADASRWRWVGRTCQRAYAPRHVFAGEGRGCGRLAELACRGELKLAILRGGSGGLESYALQVTPAAAAQRGERKKQEGPDGTRTGSVHDAPPNEGLMRVG